MTTVLERRYERRDTAANWAASNPVLAAGEWGYDTTLKIAKIGDGTTAWNDLGAIGASSDDPVFYVAAGSRASDSNDGRSWSSPFATYAAARTALGTAAGKIELGFGSFTITSDIETTGENQAIVIGQGNGTEVRAPSGTIDSLVRLQHSGCTAGNFLLTTAVSVTYAVTISGEDSASTNHFSRAFDIVYVPDAGTTTTASFPFGPDFPGSSTVDVAGCQFNRCTSYSPGATVTHTALVGNGTSANVLANHYNECQGIFSDYGITWNGGSAIWNGGQFGYCGESEMQVLKPSGGPMKICNGRSEGSTMFLKSGYVGRGSSALRIDAWDASALDPADGETVINHAAGSLHISGGSISCVGGDSKITVDPSGGGVGGSEYVFTSDTVTYDSDDPFRGLHATGVVRNTKGTLKLVAGEPVANPAADATGAWNAYTPTIGGTGWAIGNGLLSGRWAAVSGVVHVEITITWGSTSTFGSAALTVSWPTVAPPAATLGLSVARATALDAGSNLYNLNAYTPDDIKVTLYSQGGTNGDWGGGVISTNPFTWANGDSINISAVYEAA